MGARRFRRAAAIVAAGAVALGASAVAEPPTRPSVAHEALAGDVWAAGDTGSLLDEARRAGRPGGGANAPPSFSAEALDVSGVQGVRFDRASRTVGFLRDEGAQDAFAACRAELEGKGWRCAESGMPSMATFAKPDGTYRWLALSCVQVGDKASVVVQYEAEDE